MIIKFSLPDTAKYEALNKELKSHLDWKRKNDFWLGVRLVLPFVFEVIDRLIDKSKNRKK
jgi:hypothetical protein